MEYKSIALTAWRRLKKTSKGIVTHPRVRLVAGLWVLAFVVLVAFLFSHILKGFNSLEFFPRRLTFPLALHACTALVLALVFGFLKSPRTLAGKVTALLFVTLLLADYDSRLMQVAGLFRAVVPFLPEPSSDLPIISVLFLICLGGIGILLGKWTEKLQARYPDSLSDFNVLGAVGIVAGVIFLSQLGPMVQVLSTVQPQASHESTTELHQAATMQRRATDPSKPDIYYIVLDRYANQSVLQDQFGFDNTAFTSNLEEMGYQIDPQAKSAYPFTAPSLASTLNLGFLNDDVQKFTHDSRQSVSLFNNMSQRSEVAKLLKQEGYQYINVGSSYNATNEARMADIDYANNYELSIFGIKKRLRGASTLAFIRSPYYRLATTSFSWWPLKLKEMSEPDYALNQLSTLKGIATDSHQGGRFIVAHILLPHPPYFFNADGSRNTQVGTDNLGMPVEKKYLQQLQFTNTQIQKVLDAINQHSQQRAVVLLMADEGPYPSDMHNISTVTEDMMAEGNMQDWAKKDVELKFGTLQALHIPRATEDDQAHFTSANAFRIVLNRYFGYSFDYLPECHFGLTKGREEMYFTKNVNALMQVNSSKDCQEFDTAK